MGTSIIVGMATATVVSALAEIALNAAGKQDKAQLLNFTTTAGLLTTAAMAFIKFAKAVSGL